MSRENDGKVKDADPKVISVSVEKSLSDKNEAQKVAAFIIYLMRECLLFEQLNEEQINLKKRKRIKLMSQICTRVDMMEIAESLASSSHSPTKRQRTETEVSSPHDENNNTSSDMDEEKDTEEHFKLGSSTLSARRLIWIGNKIY